jgi:hypothetical protein
MFRDRDGRLVSDAPVGQRRTWEPASASPSSIDMAVDVTAAIVIDRPSAQVGVRFRPVARAPSDDAVVGSTD